MLLFVTSSDLHRLNLVLYLCNLFLFDLNLQGLCDLFKIDLLTLDDLLSVLC